MLPVPARADLALDLEQSFRPAHNKNTSQFA